MNDAFKIEQTFDKNGRCTSRSISVGGTVIYGIVALVGIWTGKLYIALPPIVMNLWKRWAP